MAIYYEIRVAGLVPAAALRGFEQLTAQRPTETVVRGPLPDQAALHGLLARLESSGIQLVGLRKQRHPPPSGPLIAVPPDHCPGAAESR